MQHGLLERIDAGFGGEQGLEVFGEALPVGGQIGGVGALGERADQGLDEPGMGAGSIRLLRLQPVAEGHQLIDFGDYAVLFGERRDCHGHFPQFSKINSFLSRSLAMLIVVAARSGGSQLERHEFWNKFCVNYCNASL